MKKIFLIFTIFITTNICFAQTYSHRTYYPNYRYDINRLEKRILKQTYDYDTQSNRIERLEKKVFGASQTGTLNDRMMLLKNASQNYKSYNPEYKIPQTYQRPIFTGSSGSSWRSLLMGNFMNQFAGTATGFTPTLTPGMDPAFMDYFEAERALSVNGDKHDYADIHRSMHSNTERNSGASVRILD